MESSVDYELVAQQVSELMQKIAVLEARLDAAEKVGARLEVAALTTARSMQEISHHWDAVYEAMRRAEQPEDQDDELNREEHGSRSGTRE